MKTIGTVVIIILIITSQKMLGQQVDPFLHKYSIYKSYNPEKAKEYKDIDGSPYLDKEFVDGTLFFKDTTVVKLPLRYNIYTDQMEYQSKGVNYIVINPHLINKISFGQFEFVYLPFIQNGSYFELFELGKCTVVEKKLIAIKPLEVKAMGALIVPARFSRKPTIIYMIVNDTDVYRIKNIKSVINALQDQKPKIENFIKKEKIKNINKDNLIKITKHYNSLSTFGN